MIEMLFFSMSKLLLLCEKRNVEWFCTRLVQHILYMEERKIHFLLLLHMQKYKSIYYCPLACSLGSLASCR